MRMRLLRWDVVGLLFGVALSACDDDAIDMTSTDAGVDLGLSPALWRAAMDPLCLATGDTS